MNFTESFGYFIVGVIFNLMGHLLAFVVHSYVGTFKKFGSITLRSKVIKNSVFANDQSELKYTQCGLDLHQLNILFNIFQAMAYSQTPHPPFFYCAFFAQCKKKPNFSTIILTLSILTMV